MSLVRIKKSLTNSVVGMITYILAFLPVFIVRKVFINTLGEQLLGLSSLYTNIISYLSIVEMGIGSAIIYSLYKPYADGDRKKVNAYLKYYEKFYKRIGFIILILGIIITPFLHFFIKDNIDINTVRIGFILFLINTVIGYMFTYKHCLLNVAQESYKVSSTITGAKIVIAIVQVIVLKITGNFYLYISVQAIVNLIFYLILNNYINKKFEWIKNADDKISKIEEEGLVKNIKALFCHKIGGILVLGTDNIVVSTFVNLKSVANYNNYAIITSACNGIVGQLMNGITASIGNLLVEDNKDKAYEVHKRLFFMNFWIASFIVISLFNTITHFISLWVGEKYSLDILTVSFILFNLYFHMMRGQVEQFKNASGQFYKDRYAPICEGIINLVSSVILVNMIGLPGVFLGTLISNMTVIFWTQPKIVYKYVFDRPLIEYFKRYLKYLLIAIIPLTLTIISTNSLKGNITISSFMLNCLINIVIINGFYLIIFWKNKDFIYFKNIFLKLVNKVKVSK